MPFFFPSDAWVFAFIDGNGGRSAVSKCALTDDKHGGVRERFLLAEARNHGETRDGGLYRTSHVRRSRPIIRGASKEGAR